MRWIKKILDSNRQRLASGDEVDHLVLTNGVGRQKKVSGTFHLTWWIEKAHVKEGSLISAETLGANCSHRRPMVQGFLHGLKSLQECAPNTPKATYSTSHQQYSTFYQGIQDLCPSMFASCHTKSGNPGLCWMCSGSHACYHI
jgi:hypothetical protein